MASDKRYLNLTWIDPESGASRVRDYPLPLTIGRDTGNEVVLPTAGVSRQHCQIEADGDEVIVTDLNSSNGTFVNGEQISRSTLSEGDELTIGDLTLKISFSITRRATSMDNLFDALTEGEAEATITLKSLKTKDLFADIESPKITKPIEENKIQTSELHQPPALSGDELKEFLGGKLQKDIEKDIAPDVEQVTSDMRREHDTAMRKLQDKAEVQNAAPEGAINKFLASLRRLFGG
jgi:predicted component of type VI protein secretion system